MLLADGAWNMDDIHEALGRVAEAIRARGAIPEEVIIGLESLRRTVVGWLTPDARALLAPEHGRWVVTPTGTRLDLSSRPILRRVVGALVEQRVTAPGVPLTAGALVAAGWPEMPVVDAASLNRLRVAVTRLRRAGLEDVIVTTNDGWMLRPSIAVERVL